MNDMISKIHPIPAFTDNYIWAIHEADSTAMAVVDPGDATPVLKYMEQNERVLSHVLITHHHYDHIGGLAQLISSCKPVVFGPQPSCIRGITDFVHEGDYIELFGSEFTVLELPGHTLDHIAYYSNTLDPPVLFCGDSLFAAGCGRLFEGTPEMMFDSLNKLMKLDPAAEVYCTHEYTMANLQFALAVDGDNKDLQARVASEQAKRDRGLPTLPSSIGLELATNPFLRCDRKQIKQQVSDKTGSVDASSEKVFAALRSWKDRFQ